MRLSLSRNNFKRVTFKFVCDKRQLSLAQLRARAALIHPPWADPWPWIREIIRDHSDPSPRTDRTPQRYASCSLRSQTHPTVSEDPDKGNQMLKESSPISFHSQFKSMSPQPAATEPKTFGQIPLPRLPQSSDMTAFESQLNELHSTVTRLDSNQRLRQASVDAVDRKISSIQSMATFLMGSRTESTTSSGEYFYAISPVLIEC
jgi:hypothetical protein